MDEARMMEFVERAVGDVGALLGGSMVVIGAFEIAVGSVYATDTIAQRFR